MRPPPVRHAFTLVELMVVVSIIVLVSAVTLPTVLPALTSRQVNESARILQAAIAGARDSAIHANAPRGIRLLPDATLTETAPLARGGFVPGQILTSSRFVPIEPAPDLNDQAQTFSASFVNRSLAAWTNAGGLPPPFPFPLSAPGGVYPYPPSTAAPMVLLIVQAVSRDNNPSLGPNPATNWFWNVRIGDKIRLNASGHYYTVVGPMTVANPENLVNDGPADVNPFGPMTASLAVTVFSFPVPQTVPPTPPTPVVQHPEYLFLVNGIDDDGDGYIDPGLDGIDRNPLPVLVNGVTDEIAEWIETETWVGSHGADDAATQNPTFLNPNSATYRWSIARRPVVSPGAREVSLPGGATIDLTTWDTTRERSRLPVNPFNRTVDILINQAGQLVPTTYYSSPSSFSMAGSFLHFWIADRQDVTPPVGASYPTLPIGIDAANVPRLKGDRFLVTVFSRSGQVVTNSIENFDVTDAGLPYADAQLGNREAK